MAMERASGMIPALHMRKSNLREGRDFSADSAKKGRGREGPHPPSPQPSRGRRNLTARAAVGEGWGRSRTPGGRGLKQRRHASPRWRPIGDPCRHFPGQKTGRRRIAVAVGLETTAPFKAERPGTVGAGQLLHSGSCPNWGEPPEFW